MPTPDRTTIAAALGEFVNQLGANLVADPLTASAPFRKVAVGAGDPESHPRPFLAVRLLRARTADVVDDDRLIEVTVELRLVSDVFGADSLTPLLERIGAVDDYLDGARDGGVIEGAEGFDDRVWTFDEPRSAAGARLATATAALAFVVKSKRGENRVPAA